jgi:hypothetical protein
MNNNKLKILILSITILLLAIAGFFVFRRFEKKSKNINFTIQQKLETSRKSQDEKISTSSELGKESIESTTTPEIATNDQAVMATSSQAMDMLFFGDLMLDRYVGENIRKYGYVYPFLKLFDCGSTTQNCLPIDPSLNIFFQKAEVVSVNLEGAVTDKGKHYPPGNSYDFAFDPKLIGNLKKFGINYLSIANNHLSDQGADGISQTAKNLDKLGIAYAGCIDALVGDCSSRIIEKNGKKISMVSLSMVYKKFDQQKTNQIIKSLDAKSDLVVVNIHWGIEYSHQFSKSQQAVAHQLADSGADLIIGHHPHVVQGMEIYGTKNIPIFYSLGNFIFDQYFSSDTQEELAVGVVFSDGKPKIVLFPMNSSKSQPAVLAGKAKAEFLKKFTSWSLLDTKIKASIEKRSSLEIN